MTDTPDLSDFPEADFDQPCGYVRHAASIDRVKSTVALAVGPSNFGENAAGVSYFNLTAFAADLLSRPGQKIVTSQRALIDCGADGKVLTPLGQQTGICDGCSFGEAAFVAWCARYVMTGEGQVPRECSFLWPYINGRVLSITGSGDSGACPPYSAQAYRQLGVLPVDCVGKPGSAMDLTSKPPHGPNSQESLCIQMRDNPRILPEWVDQAAPFKSIVYSPDDAEGVADCVYTGRPVTFGAHLQGRETAAGSSGVSALYRFPRNGGHETFASGFFRLKGRLGFIKTESWWNALYPASGWPGHRVTIQADDGPHVLYPGQSAIWADQWMSGRPECWAIDAPGTAA